MLMMPDTIYAIAGSEVVLGPPAPVCFMRLPDGCPIEQAISRQRLRPGSGFLSVKVTSDGPTRVLQISDVKQKVRMKYPKLLVQERIVWFIQNVYARLEERDWLLINEDKRPSIITSGMDSRGGSGSTSAVVAAPTDKNKSEGEWEFQIVMLAKAGIGISLVTRDPAEELLYAFMLNVVVDYQSSSLQKILDGSIQNIQIDNQLADAQCPIVLYLSPASKNDEHRHMPAVHFTANKSASNTDNAEIYKLLMVTVKNVTLTLEEELFCKALKFAGITRSDAEMEQIDESAFETQKALLTATATATRYYFGNLKLTLNQVRLSVLKSNKLSPDLQAVKRKLGLSLITFEDANIELDPFVRVHPFETINFLTNAVVRHYQDELLSQAVLILGSTDFLGNPIGFLNDLSEGVSGLVSDGNVGGLFKNVAHGAANSAAKMTGSLSAGLSKATLDERYDERRLMIRRRRGDKNKEHLVAGLKGLGFGVLGGLTSVVTETYDGVAHDGISGFFSGLGWGLVGTISKPAIGVLDLATGAATAVRESSRSSSKQLPKRLRPPRLVLGPGGSMPVFGERSAAGQEMMYKMNGRDYNEIYVAHEQLRSGEDDLQILITSDRVLVFTGVGGSGGGGGSSGGSNRQLLTVTHGDLVSARMVSEKEEGGPVVASPVPPPLEEKFYLEILINEDAMEESDDDDIGVGYDMRRQLQRRNRDLHKRPQVRCDSERVARTVAQQINYARTMYEERTQAVIDDEIGEQEE